MKFQASIPTNLWGDCLLTSTYLLNRIPSPVLGNISLYEKLFHKPPSYDQLKVFGCLAFMSQHDSDKLSPRAIKTVFLGYPLLKKGYKLYDMETNTFHYSRHVVFHESIFPFSDKPESGISHSTNHFVGDFDSPLDHSVTFDHDNSTISTDHENNETTDQFLLPVYTSSNYSTSSLSFPHPDYLSDQNDDLQPASADISSRISSRPKTKPVWMQDYVLSNQSIAHASTVLTTCTHDNHKFSMSNYSPPFPVYACSVSPATAVSEPFSFKQASTDSRWIEAMNKEL